MSKFKQIFAQSSNPNFALNPTRHRDRLKKYAVKKLPNFKIF